MGGMKKPDIIDRDDEALSVETLTPQELAELHEVPITQINHELSIGIQTEQEHTKDLKIAREIALDHLLESPKYYTELRKMEKKF